MKTNKCKIHPEVRKNERGKEETKKEKGRQREEYKPMWRREERRTRRSHLDLEGTN